MAKRDVSLNMNHCYVFADDSQTQYKTRAELRQIPSGREQFTAHDLQQLIELHPPAIMPNGNVGTPTHIFLDLIRECKLPPAVIKKLGLQFPHARRKRRYGTVPFDYDSEVVKEDIEEPSYEVKSGKGDLIEDENQHTGKKSDNVTGNQRTTEEEILEKKQEDSSSEKV